MLWSEILLPGGRRFRTRAAQNAEVFAQKQEDAVLGDRVAVKSVDSSLAAYDRRVSAGAPYSRTEQSDSLRW
jgi:hypothetical protein